MMIPWYEPHGRRQLRCGSKICHKVKPVCCDLWVRPCQTVRVVGCRTTPSWWHHGMRQRKAAGYWNRNGSAEHNAKTEVQAIRLAGRISGTATRRTATHSDKASRVPEQSNADRLPFFVDCIKQDEWHVCSVGGRGRLMRMLCCPFLCAQESGQ